LHQIARWLAAEGHSLALTAAGEVPDAPADERMLELALELQGAGAIVMSARPPVAPGGAIDVAALADLIDAFGRVDLCLTAQSPLPLPAGQPLPARLNVVIPRFAEPTEAGGPAVAMSAPPHARGERLHVYEIVLPRPRGASEAGDSGICAAFCACLRALRPSSGQA
jgi:hypothetical protein